MTSFIPRTAEPWLASAVRRVGRRVLIDINRFDAALAGHEPDPAARPMFLTIRQVVDRHPGFTEPALRQLIARAEKGEVDA